MRTKSNKIQNPNLKTQKFIQKKKEVLKLTTILAERLNKESVKFSSEISLNKAPTVWNIVWTILTPKLMLNAVKAAPSLQKDVNKMLKFIENPIENYNPNKPPFFLQLIEEHLNSVPDPQNQTLKDYLVSKQTTLTLALEKLITQVVVPTLMTTGTEANLNKLRNKIHKHQTDLKNLPNLKKELEKLQKQHGLDSKNKQLSTLSKKVLKLTNLQSEYSNALIINILLKHGIDSKYLIANLTPTITAITHSLLSNAEQILSISSYALNILKTENQNTKQEFLYKIFNTIDLAALLNANVTEKLNNLIVHQGQKLREAMHAILGNPELNIAQDLIKSFNIDPHLINTTIALIPKLMNNLPVDQKQLTNLYNALKEVLTDDLENKFFSSTSLEQIAAIDNANIGKLMSLGGTILKEYGSMSDTNDNIAQDMEEFLLDPKIQKNITQIASSALPQFFDSRNTYFIELSDKLSNKNPDFTNQQVHDIINSIPGKLFTNVPANFFAHNLPNVLNIAANFLRNTSSIERRQFYMATGNILTYLGHISNLQYISKELNASNRNIPHDTLLKPFATMSKDIIKEIQTLEQLNINLLHSIQDDNINSITKELLITKQQSVQQETLLLEKHLNILQHDTISSKQIDEAIYTLENHTIPRLMNILINEHIFPLLEQPDIQNILSKEVSQLLLKEENASVFTTLVLNSINSIPNVRDVFDKNGIALNTINNLISSEPNIVKPLVTILGHLIDNNPKELLDIAAHVSYMSELSKQTQKLDLEIKHCKNNDLLQNLIHNKNKLINLQNDAKSNITDHILTLLRTNQGQLLQGFSFLINSLDQKQPLLQKLLESVYNNKVVQENLKKTGIKYETINEFIPITFNLLNKLFSDQDRILSSIELFQSLKQTKITNEQLTSFLVELASAGIGVKIPPSIFDERIKQELALTLNTMPITINPQDFYNQITDSIKRLPPEWQIKINISKSRVNEPQFDNIILKYKQQEAEILLNTSAKLLHKNSFIIQDIANAISPTFETLLNTQLKELNYKLLQITLIGVDNAVAIFKDSILMLSKLSQAVSTNLVRDDSEIMSILSTVYKFQMLDNKILNLNDTLLSIQKADPKNKNKINSIYKQLNTCNKEKNQMLLNGINQFSNLIKKYNSQDLLFQDLSEFFEKHHSSIDLILKNAMSQEGILTEYLDINSKQMIAIVKDNNERLLSIGNHYIQGNYIRAILHSIPLLKDSNVRDILGQAFNNFINTNIFSLFRSSSKINHEVQTNLQAILHESRYTMLSSIDPNVLHRDSTHKFMDKKIPITERLIKRAAEIERSSNVLNYDTKKLIYTLRSRNLSSQMLPNIDFSNADIERFNFSDSTLNNISFQNSTILNTSFKHVNFVGVPNFHGTTIDSHTLATLLPAIKNFNKSHPKHITLDHIKIKGDITNLSFKNISLRNANLTEATIINSNHSKTKATFKHANLEGAQFNSNSMLNPDLYKSARKIKSPSSPEQIVYNILRDTLVSTQKNLVNNFTLSQEVITILTQDLKKALRLDQNSVSKYLSSDSLYKNVEKIAKDLKQTLEKTPAPSQNIRKILQDIIAKHNKPTISSHRR